MGWMFDYDGTPTLGGAGVLAVAALAVILGGCGISNNWKYSEGDKVGMVNTISRKGTFAVTKTYEGQMALEGISGSGNSLGANIWHFSIDNYLPMKKQEELAERVSEFMNSGQKARVHYVQMFKTWPTRSGSSYLIQSVEPVGVAGRPAPASRLESGTEVRGAVQNGNEVYLDGKHYLLKHDANGKLKVTELREVQ